MELLQHLFRGFHADDIGVEGFRQHGGEPSRSAADIGNRRLDGTRGDLRAMGPDGGQQRGESRVLTPFGIPEHALRRGAMPA